MAQTQDPNNSPRFTQTSGYSTGHYSSGVPSQPDTSTITQRMSREEQETAHHAARFGWGPLAHVQSQPGQPMHAAFGGELQPGLFKGVEQRKFANPAPLGLCAFALTTFFLSLINLGTRNVHVPNMVVGPALGYGGLVQLLAGMWEMAIGNTFGATALSSYGGFWISIAIILTPGGFQIEEAYTSSDPDGFAQAFALYLFAWTILTFFFLLCTLKSTVAFFTLFALLDLAFLFLACAYQNSGPGDNEPHVGLLRAGGAFGVLAAFAAWYNALAGLMDSSNSFFLLPVVHFPWSNKGTMGKSEGSTTANGGGSVRQEMKA